jgi:ribosomal protein S18 acetylase RimI-like enzyme
MAARIIGFVMTESQPILRLRPMSGDEYEAFSAASIVAYARDIEEHGGYTAEFARQKSEADHAAILPSGLETPGNAIFVLEADGERVGVLWVAEREMGGRQVLYIYDVEVDERYRGRGYGRAAMLLAEDEARKRGLSRLELNVFGGNEVARKLYRSLGYLEAAVHMGKDLG